MVMTLKWILSKSEQKNLNVQFGAVASTYSNCVTLGLCTMAFCLADHPKAKVFWDQSIEALQYASKRTKMFLDVPNVVGMMDGIKFRSREPLDQVLQNSNYNGWTCSVYRNCVFVWDPFGKIVDCVLNNPGSMHDSKMTRWGNIY